MVLLQQIGYVVAFLMAGSILKYLLPYVIEGLVQIGLENPWPRWQWRYLSAFALALIGFGLPMLTMPGFFGQLAALPPIALIAFAYAGNEMSRVVAKAIERLAGQQETI
jgi:hypothetical protein